MSEKKDISEMSGEELSGAVHSILSDPAFAKLVGELSGGAPKEAETDREEKSAPAQSQSVPQISPEMLARLPQMMSAMAPLVSGMRGKTDGKDDGKGGSPGDAEKRKKLLSALRPYLSSQRKDAIDSILKVTEMTDLIGQFGVGKPREK